MAKRPPFDLKRILDWLDVGRSLAALLFIPVVTLLGIGLVLILWLSFPKLSGGDISVLLEIVKWFGMTLVGTLALIGGGMLWLQRRDLPDLSIQTPWGSATISDGPDGHEGQPNVSLGPTGAAITAPETKVDGRQGGAEGDVAR